MLAGSRARPSPALGLMACVLVLGCSGNTESQTGPMASGPDLDVAGTWHDCGSRLALGSDGSFVLERLLGACKQEGLYSVSGDQVTFDYQTSTCATLSPKVTVEAVKLAGRLVLVAPDGTDTYFSESAPRARFELTGKGTGNPGNGTSIVRIVGDPSAPPFSGCYYSADMSCGGFLSCGGSVDEWQLDEAKFVAKLGCTGPCPCSAVLQGSPSASGDVPGFYDAIDCSGAYSGTFVLAKTAD